MPVCSSVCGIYVGGMCYIKRMSSQVRFLSHRPLSQTHSVHSVTAKCSGCPPHPSWVGRGAEALQQGAGLRGALGPPGSDALQMTSHPLPPVPSWDERREETEMHVQQDGPG